MSKLTLDILDEYIYKTKDLNLLVQKLYYEEMYTVIYDYYFKKIKHDDELDKFLHIAFMIYKHHNKLKNNLFFSNQENDLSIDIDLINFVTDKIYNGFNNDYNIKLINKDDFKNILTERIEFNYTVINNLKNKILKLEKY